MPADLTGAPRVYTSTEAYLASKGTGFKPQEHGCFRVYQTISTILTGDKPPHNWQETKKLGKAREDQEVAGKVVALCVKALHVYS